MRGDIIVRSDDPHESALFVASINSINCIDVAKEPLLKRIKTWCKMKYRRIFRVPIKHVKLPRLTD